MKRILGLDLGTNSIGWALIEQDFDKKEGKIIGLGSRIIPMSQDVINNFGKGVSISQTAERTEYRGVRRLNERFALRRERLHRVLNLLGFLPNHYAEKIDFEKKKGQFAEEVKLNYRPDSSGNYEFIFDKSFQEMSNEFAKKYPDLKVPYDWTIYYLRKKALHSKISKQELAWILLNFNQKRGYYQLRGEEEENNDKVEDYYAFQVIYVQETEDKNSRGIWYNVILENGWVYRRQSNEPLNNWVGKVKEFIVTTTLDKDGKLKKDKDGNVKRSFRAVDSEKDWIAIKRKTEQNIESSGKTVGEYIYDKLLKNPTQKIRGELVKTIDRKHYKSEIQQILKEQFKHHPEFSDEYIYQQCLDELYPRNESYQANLKEKGLFYLLVDDILFYQRPLKSKKSTISDCPFETRKYKNKEGKIIEKPYKCISKSHPVYQEFRLWQFLHNLRIIQKIDEIKEGEDSVNNDITQQILPTDEEKVKLFDFFNEQNEINQEQLLNYFIKKKQLPKPTKGFDYNYRWNYVEDKKYPCNSTRSEFIKRLSKVENVNPTEFLTSEVELHLWHIVYSVKDKKQFEKALKTFAKKHQINEESFLENFSKMKPFNNDYGAYSHKAIKKILPLMRIGKYWNDEEISSNTKSRLNDILNRLKAIDFDKDQLQEVADDDVTIATLKSFQKLDEHHFFSGLNTYQACYAVYARHSEVAVITQWKTAEQIDDYLQNIFKQHQLRNPIVEQVITETLRVVKDIWEHYGKGEEGFFDEIHIELGREMKNSADKRKRLSEIIAENENRNERIKAILQELKDENVEGVRPHSPSQQEILKIYEEGIYDSQKEVSDEIEKIRKNASPSKKEITTYKLWLEQGYISPYTGKPIPLSRLFTTDYQIEHIIPQSRYFDNSLNNKVICESAVNDLKGNKTSYEFLNEMGGATVATGSGSEVPLFKFDDFQNHCNHYFKKNTTKLKKLLTDEIPDSFIERQMNDSRYISKVVKSLLGNIVRQENDQEATPKNLVPVVGAVTAKLRQDWGLNDKWNEIIQPRFERLNHLTESEDFGYWDNTINAFRNQVPDEISKGFSTKRIDHRHHALDALVVACTTKDHVNYITSLNTNRKNYSLVNKLRNVKNIQKINQITGEITEHDVAKSYKKPWKGFTVAAKKALETTITSFKQNLRVINRTNNKTWYWKKEDGEWKKKLQKQKGKNFAIRKPLHKETVYGEVNLPEVKLPKGKNITASRADLGSITTRKRLESITDISIQKILNNHVKNYIDEKGKERFDLAFSPEGIDDLNENIVKLNNKKFHHPIKKVRLYEVGSKFQVGNKGNKSEKFVEAAKGTNLFFAVYWDEENQKRNYETVPLNEVIAHQKLTTHLSWNEKTPIPVKPELGKYLFSLSPNDLVYVPTEEELDNPSLVDFNILDKNQSERIMVINDFTGSTIYFTPVNLAKSITTKEVDLSYDLKKNRLTGSFDTKTASLKGKSIKEICWKLKLDRLGNIQNVIR